MNASPPRLAKRLLKLLCARVFHEEVEGDLDELYHHNYESRGKRIADLRYWGDVLKHFNRYFILRRNVSKQSQNQFDMWTNYIRIAIRNFRKSLGYSSLNILGLGVGMACALLILLYTLHEFSFDRFHEESDNTYLLQWELAGEVRFGGVSPNALLPSMLREMPEIKHGARIYNRGGFLPYSLKYQDKLFRESRLFHVDSSFFNVFSFPLLAGTKEEVLSQPRSIVLTRRMQQKYFGNSDAIGEVIRVDDQHDYVVRGIVQDPPANSHMHFDFLVPMLDLDSEQRQESWTSARFYAYITVSGEATQQQIESKINGLVDRLREGESNDSFTILPLTDIHLKGLGANFGLEAQSDIDYLYIFEVIGLLVVLIASINYTNLSTARAVYRAKEIGMRKVLGAHRFNLIGQFVVESLLMVLVSLLLAYALAVIALPSFNQLAEVDFGLPTLFSQAILIRSMGLGLFIGVLASIYPALVLSGFKPVAVLRGKFKNSRSGSFMRKLLVIFQFAISAGLIIATMVLFNQLSYMQNKELGYSNNNMLVLPLSTSVQDNFQSFKAEMLKEPGVMDITLSSQSPTSIRNKYGMRIEGIATEKAVGVDGLRADADFLDVLDLELVAGDFYTRQDMERSSEDIPFEDRVYSFVVNEAALIPFSLAPEEAIGKQVNLNRRKGRIKGVIKDFHFASLRQKISPMVIFTESDFNKILMRVGLVSVESTLSRIQQRWRKLAPDAPFEYEFMDVEYGNLYRSEQKLSTLFGAFAVLAIFIACFGLLGLVSYAMIQKAQEIGVRKVLGASVNNLVVMLNKDFVKLVFLAFLISAPLAYFLMKGWLNEFEYRISIGLMPLVLALIVTLGLAFLTVSFQSVRAAMANPVDVLKEE